jgi:hypothetical protein
MMYLVTFALFSLLLTASPAKATPRWLPQPDLAPYQKPEVVSSGYDDVTMLRIAQWMKAAGVKEASPKVAKAH